MAMIRLWEDLHQGHVRDMSNILVSRLISVSRRSGRVLFDIRYTEMTSVVSSLLIHASYFSPFFFLPLFKNNAITDTANKATMN